MSFVDVGIEKPLKRHVRREPSFPVTWNQEAEAITGEPTRHIDIDMSMWVKRHRESQEIQGGDLGVGSLSWTT